MALDEAQAIEIIESPKNTALIQSVKMQESQLRVFTEDLDESEIKQEPYYTELMKTMKARSQKKYERVCDFMRFPLPVVEDSDAILNDFFKVFDGKNRYFNITGDRDISRVEEWISENKLEEWIEENIRDVWKKKPNSFVVVDSNEKGPYLINIDSSRLHDAEFKNKNGQLSYICFIHSQEKDELNDAIITRYAVYDDENYYVFQRRSDSSTVSKVSSVKHNIGYCPAHSFITDCSTDKNKFKRRVAFSKSLSRLEDFTIYDVWGNYLDSYAPFPVTEAPKSKCSNNQCEQGKVPEQIVTDPQKGTTKTVYNDCEVCDGGKNDGTFIGPGTHIGITVREQGNDGSGVFKMHFPETDKLKLIPEKIENILIHVKHTVVGVNGMVSKEAVNELQAKGGFESMESVILRNKKTLEHIYVWIVKTVSSMYYKNSKINIEANYGTKWYLSSEDELQERFKKAKEVGLPPEELINIYKELINTKYKGNGKKVARELMLVDIDPFPMYSIQDCILLKKESVLDDFQLSLKVNFIKFINRFEDENIEITEFGTALEYSKRISIIEKTISLYNEQLIEAKNERNNPNKDEGKNITQEQLEAQARLKGSVGGVQGILGIQEGVQNGTTSRDAGIQTLIEIYGFDEDTSIRILGEVNKSTPKTDVNL